MHFFQHEPLASPIDDFLTKIESAAAEDLSPDAQPPADIPTLEQFLEEEDVLRECRSENERLTKYFCKPQIISALVQYAVNPPSPLTPKEELNGTASQSSPDSSTSPTIDEENEKLGKYAYVSSEILSADIKPLSATIVENDDLMGTIFSSLEGSNHGELNPLVPVYFSKVIISLLKMRNLETIEQMSKRSPSFLNSILLHMDNGSIAELIVRILDGPEADRSYQVKKPANQALDLLADNDILSGLAECFVRASNNIVDLDQVIANCDIDSPVEMAPDGDTNKEQQFAKQRRLREETMANVTTTLLGLSERILQFPSLGCRIPDKLSPYSTPDVVSRLLDAGLYACCNGETKHDGLKASDYSASSEERVHAFTTGSNSALLHSLGLAADLMTTEANVVRKEEDEQAAVAVQGTGVVNRQMMLGLSRQIYSGRGIGASISSVDASDNDPSQATSQLDDESAQILADFASKKSGDPITSTNLLEEELAIRFRRLSEMFGEVDVNSITRSRPLGSLRLKLAEFFVACMKKSREETVHLIIELKVPNKLLDLFRGYQWSSMLHGVVTNSIVSALEGDEVGRPARTAWFGAGLIPWLIDAWTRNMSDEESGTLRCRAGYMGHLIRIGTSLKGYIHEYEADPEADLPPQSELESFAVFAERILAPAHHLEATPLCGGAVAGSGLSDADEGEEATDVLEMGGISFSEPLADGTNASNDMQLKYMPTQTEEEEEIKAVEVEDLHNFGKGGDLSIKSMVDHDIPTALREHLGQTGKIEVESIRDLNPEDLNPSVELLDGDTKYSEAVEDDELRGVIDNIDSSSEDEGSYVAFVDDRKDTGGPSPSLLTELHKMKMSDGDPSNSLDGVVTEIDEPAPFNSSDCLQSLASNIISVPEEAGNSSDEEYEAWEDPARVRGSASSESTIQSTEDSQTSGVA